MFKIILLRVYVSLIILISIAPLHHFFQNDYEQNHWNFFILKIVPFDKVVHFSLYLILAIMLVKIFPTSRSSLLIKALIFGFLMEIVQISIPYRSFDYFDLFANLLGVTFPFVYELLLKKQTR